VQDAGLDWRAVEGPPDAEAFHHESPPLLLLPESHEELDELSEELDEVSEYEGELSELDVLGESQAD